MRVIGLAGFSGAGKTTLALKLIPALVARGVRVSTLKHAHHAFEIDHPGKDSFEHRMAGAAEVLIASSGRVAIVQELRGAPEPPLGDLIRRLRPVDLVLVEGFKRERHPKIEVFRAANGKPWLHPDDPMIRAIAADAAPPDGRAHIALDDVAAVADAALVHALPVDAVFGSGSWPS